MRPGGGHAKGAGFERESCLKLSLWVSGGARTDLFTRNVLSGGRFTIALARNEQHGTPGDMMASHPTAFDFASLFLVECKSYKDLDWPGFIYDEEKSFIGKTIKLCREHGAHAGLRFFLIVKQNQRKPMLIVSHDVGRCMAAAKNRFGIIDYHLMHNESLMVMPMAATLDNCNPTKFLAGVKALCF